MTDTTHDLRSALEPATRDDAIKFLENAARNWRHFPRLNNDDLDDVATALTRHAQKAVETARAGQGWQPIETAPKGRDILLAGNLDGPHDWRVKVGGFNPATGKWLIFGASWSPTHWMLLPAPPKTTTCAISQTDGLDVLAAPATDEPVDGRPTENDYDENHPAHLWREGVTAGLRSLKLPDHRESPEPAAEPVGLRALLDRAELAWQRFFYPAADNFTGPIGDKLPSIDLEVADCLRLVLAELGRHVVTPETDIPALATPARTDDAARAGGDVAAMREALDSAAVLCDQQADFEAAEARKLPSKTVGYIQCKAAEGKSRMLAAAIRALSTQAAYPTGAGGGVMKINQKHRYLIMRNRDRRYVGSTDDLGINLPSAHCLVDTIGEDGLGPGIAYHLQHKGAGR